MDENFATSTCDLSPAERTNLRLLKKVTQKIPHIKINSVDCSPIKSDHSKRVEALRRASTQPTPLLPPRDADHCPRFELGAPFFIFSFHPFSFPTPKSTPPSLAPPPSPSPLPDPRLQPRWPHFASPCARRRPENARATTGECPLATGRLPTGERPRRHQRTPAGRGCPRAPAPPCAATRC